jgi:hypothetical protein
MRFIRRVAVLVAVVAGLLGASVAANSASADPVSSSSAATAIVSTHSGKIHTDADWWW